MSKLRKNVAFEEGEDISLLLVDAEPARRPVKSRRCELARKVTHEGSIGPRLAADPCFQRGRPSA
jgi:hypothetical protein